jgi:plasmid stabilization system protein ParE
VEIKRRIRWDEQALLHLIEAIQWIGKDSIQQAEQVQNAILDFIEKAAVNPERYPFDKYKRNNQGNFRAFETHSYRITFSFDTDEIQILRVRHVRQRPLKH